MRKTKKLNFYNKLYILCIFILVTLCSMSNVLASSINTSLEVINKNSEIKNLENFQGNITKTIIESNQNQGEVTIELKLSNIKNDETNKTIYNDTEIYFLVDENLSRNDKKLNENIAYIKILMNNILKKNSNTKIGIIGLKGTINDSHVDENGKFINGEKDEGDIKGSESNSEILAELTKDFNKIENALKQMNSEKNVYHVNLQTGIRLANKSYSNNVNRILISTYDGVPGIVIGVKANAPSYGGLFGEYATAKEAIVAQHKKIVNSTKNEILNLKKNNISFIQLRPEDTSYDETWYNGTTGEKILDFDGSPYVKELYGTLENPVYGKMYSLSNSSLEEIITNYIYEDVFKVIQADINKIKIVDYFPKEIIENFDFSYIEKPNIGNVSEKINFENNSIVWNIENLKGNEIAILKYKLKLKDLQNEKILNKVISTNEKVSLTYQDSENKEYNLELLTSPQIMLKQVKNLEDDNKPTPKPSEKPVDSPKPTVKPTEDNTQASGKLPQTGVGITLTVLVMAALGIGIISLVRYNKYKDV